MIPDSRATVFGDKTIRIWDVRPLGITRPQVLGDSLSLDDSSPFTQLSASGRHPCNVKTDVHLQGPI